MDKCLGKRVVEQQNGKDVVIKDVTWIKADLTFEGLKQIIYEPEPGERVFIGPIEPDQKDDYKVIRKIKFANTDDFPEEIVFNQNICSVIGSRSSGKSALLAYIAHSIDPILAQKLNPKGPGEGFPWGSINFEYSIEWENNKSNEDSPGKIVYIPQNYLFNISEKPDEIKEKIQPVLFKVLPEFGTKYIQTELNINNLNQQIKDQTESWFKLFDSIVELNETLKNLGNKNAIEIEKKNIEVKIETLREKNQLSEEDIKKYQELNANLSAHKSRIAQIISEMSQIPGSSEQNRYFTDLKLSLTPSLESLPKILQNKIRENLELKKEVIFTEINKLFSDYKISIENEKNEIINHDQRIQEENDTLIKKHQNNIELEELIKKVNYYKKTIDDIDSKEIDKKECQDKLAICVNTIRTCIDQRISLIEKIKAGIDTTQSLIENIIFRVEYGFNDDLARVTERINIRDKSDFIENSILKIGEIRNDPEKFLNAIYSGKQKVNAGNIKKEVAQQVLSLTENILFTAEMEGDKIGGFSEPTMTPGRRALFALRLILAESEDTWPLLIDQPEDDLDSRSICDEIVPFLKKRKKERQIIMVSHNANLVIGSDSEQIIVANRNGDDRKNMDGKQFNYLTGSIECTKAKDIECKDTLNAQGIREHSCDILDGGKMAFEHRRNKYNIIKY